MAYTYDQAMAIVPRRARRIVNFCDGMSGFFGKAAAWLCAPMIAFLIYEVCMRYFLTKPTVWANDVTVLIFGIMYMLASPYCLRDGGHVRTDFFYHKWSPRVQGLADLAHYVLLFFPAHIIFLKVAWAYFSKSFGQLETSPESSWGMPIWPAKFALPLYVTLTMAQGLSESLKCYYRIKTNVDLWHDRPAEEAGERPAAAETAA